MSNKTEYKIGEEVYIDGYLYLCAKGSDEPCVQAGCDLQLHQCTHIACLSEHRKDKNDVVFKLKEER